MEEKEELQIIENETPKSIKSKFTDRFSQRFPDVSVDDEDAFYGKMDEEFDRIDRSDKAQAELYDLMNKDARTAGLLMVMKNGKNPLSYLIEMYGNDFREALDDEEKAAELSEAFSKYLEKQVKNKELQDKAEENLQKMLDELDAAQAEGSFSDDNATKAYDYLYGEGGLLERIITNEVSKADWMLLMKAADYDKMKSDAEHKIIEAREEGEIVGRNANIDMNKRKRTSLSSMPSDINASGGKTREEKPKNGALDFFNSRRKSVWED